MIEGLPFAVHGTIAMASGDNLGSTYIGGFKAPSGAFRKCRHCMATEEDMNTEVNNITTPITFLIH